MDLKLLTITFSFHILFLQASLPPPPKISPNAPKIGRLYQNSNRNVDLSDVPEGVKAGCQSGILDYPSSMPNSHYYQRLCWSAKGLAVVTDGQAGNDALDRTAWTIDNMLATVSPYVVNAMRDAGFRQAVMGPYPTETVTSLPEYSDQDPNFWDTRRGCGATDYSPVGCNAEEDVLCDVNDLYPNMDITVHEFGHSLHWLGFNHVWPQFQQDLDACYNNAYANSLWGWGYIGSYSMTNSDEYFANGLMTYFDVQWPYDEQGAPWNRDQLYQKDPMFATFLDRWMESNPWRGGCP